MPENPYEPPVNSAPAIGVLSGKREDLRLVAVLQKGIIWCILIQIFVIILQILPEARTVLAFVSLLIGLVSCVLVFMLAMRVYGVGLGILFGVMSLIPCIGLLGLLIVNQKATTVLRENGIKVGLLGAKSSDL